MVGGLRTRLGESRRSVERFTTPHFALETASLDALKAASLGTSLYGSLPKAGTASKCGTVTLGQITGQTPTYIFPITPGAFTTR